MFWLCVCACVCEHLCLYIYIDIYIYIYMYVCIYVDYIYTHFYQNKCNYKNNVWYRSFFFWLILSCLYMQCSRHTQVCWTESNIMVYIVQAEHCSSWHPFARGQSRNFPRAQAPSSQCKTCHSAHKCFSFIKVSSNRILLLSQDHRAPRRDLIAFLELGSSRNEMTVQIVPKPAFNGGPDDAEMVPVTIHDIL